MPYSSHTRFHYPSLHNKVDRRSAPSTTTASLRFHLPFVALESRQAISSINHNRVTAGVLRETSRRALERNQRKTLYWPSPGKGVRVRRNGQNAKIVGGQDSGVYLAPCMTSAMKRRRAPDRSSAAGVLGCILALVHLSFSGGTDVLSTGSSSASSSPSSRPRITESTRKLAVVVPVYRGDLLRAVSSLEQWPTSCSPVTQQNVDLVLYYAESEADNSATAATAETIAKSAGRCFSSTQTVHADLAEEVWWRKFQRPKLHMSCNGC